MFNRSKSKKLDIYTEAEAKAVLKEVKTFFNKLEKRDGKKFNQSFGCSVSVLIRGDDGKPKGSFSYGNANGFTMREVAEAAIESLSKHTNKSTIEICADLAMRTVLNK